MKRDEGKGGKCDEKGKRRNIMTNLAYSGITKG
jgi:hypothetical protein